MSSIRTSQRSGFQARRIGAVVPALILLIADLRGSELTRSSPQHETPVSADMSAAGSPTTSGKTDPAGTSLPEPKLPCYELQMDQGDLVKLDRSPESNRTYAATFIADGEVYERVRVRYRGDWARSWPKKPLKVFFSDPKPFHGHGCVNLNSAWRDPAFVREALAYHVYAVCGVPAPESRMVRLQLNGQFWGLYVEVEDPKEAFLRRYNLGGASVFKALSRAGDADERDQGGEEAYRACYEKQTEKAQGYADLQRFCRELERASNAGEFFTRWVDLDRYINYLAATVLVQNWDCYTKNHYLIYDGRGAKKWFVVPWDLDRTFGDRWDRTFGFAQLPILDGTRASRGLIGWNRLADRCLTEPTLRARFVHRLAELLDTQFTPEKLFPLLDRFESKIGPAAVLDRRRWPGGTRANLHDGIAQIKRYIEDRRTYLQRQLPALRVPMPSSREPRSGP